MKVTSVELIGWTISTLHTVALQTNKQMQNHSVCNKLVQRLSQKVRASRNFQECIFVLVMFCLLGNTTEDVCECK